MEKSKDEVNEQEQTLNEPNTPNAAAAITTTSPATTARDTFSSIWQLADDDGQQ